MAKLLKKRDRLAPVRLEMEGFEMELAAELANRLGLKKKTDILFKMSAENIQRIRLSGF